MGKQRPLWAPCWLRSKASACRCGRRGARPGAGEALWRRETGRPSRSREGPLEAVASPPGALAGGSPCTEEPGRLQSMGLQRSQTLIHN